MRTNIYSHISTHTHNPFILPITPQLLKITSTNDPTTHPTDWKDHSPPSNNVPDAP